MFLNLFVLRNIPQDPGSQFFAGVLVRVSPCCIGHGVCKKIVPIARLLNLFLTLIDYVQDMCSI